MRALASVMALTVSSLLVVACAPLVTLGASGTPKGGLELDEAKARCAKGEACACGALADWAAASNDDAEADALYAKACDGRCAASCLSLSDRRYDGKGGDASPTEGLRHGVMACKLDPALCMQVAARYEQGRGVPRDPTRARALYGEACKYHVADACARGQAIEAPPKAP